MRTKLKVRPRADVDFAEHYLYISDRSPQAAERFFNAVYDAREQIRKNPVSGLTLSLPGFERQDLRYRRPKGFDKYLIIYRVVDSTVYIPHPAQLSGPICSSFERLKLPHDRCVNVARLT